MEIRVLLVWGLFFLISCTKSVKDFRSDFYDESYVKSGDEIELELDSLTSYSSTRVQFVENCIDENQGCISILNTNTGDIYMYSFSTGALIDIIRLRNSYGFEQISGFTIESDTIYAIHAKSKVLAMYDTSGTLLQYFSLKDEPKLFAMEGFIGSTVNPIVVTSNYVNITRFFLSGNASQNKRNLTARIEKESGEIDYIQFFPDEYSSNQYGPNMSVCYSNGFEAGKIIYSFPVSGEIFIADIASKKVESLKLNAWEVGDIDPIRKKDLQSFEDRDLYYRRNPNYSIVHFDQFRKKIYRIVNFPIDVETIESSDSYRSSRKTSGIIVYDMLTGTTSQYLLPKYTFTEAMSFVAPSGLYIANRKLSGKNEDELVFSRVSFSK